MCYTGMSLDFWIFEANVAVDLVLCGADGWFLRIIPKIGGFCTGRICKYEKSLGKVLRMYYFIILTFEYYKNRLAG